MTGVFVSVLGATRLHVDGVEVPLTATQRIILARLALTPGFPVPQEQLFEAIWGLVPPASARASLHNQISRLRALSDAGLVETTGRGYVLTAPTDVVQLMAAVQEAEGVLAAPGGQLAHFEMPMSSDEEPYDDLGAAAVALGARAEVLELIATARDLEVEAALAQGATARAVALARHLAQDSPYDEGRCCRLARALAAGGRRGEALTEIAGFRRRLRTEQGLEVGPLVEDLERHLLQMGLSVRSGGGPPVDLDRVLDEVSVALREGQAVAVVGSEGSGVTAVLGRVAASLVRDHRRVARANVKRGRDVAVAPLLDLLDELGLQADPALGPLGSFVPLLKGMTDPVVLVLDDADLAGPSTRRALLEAAVLDHVCLVVGLHAPESLLTEHIDVVVRLADPPEVDPAVLRRRFHALGPATQYTLVAAALAAPDTRVTSLEALGATDGLTEAIERGMLQVVDGCAHFPDVGMRQVALAESASGIRDEFHHALGRHLLDIGARRAAAGHLLEAVAIEPLAALEAARVAAADASAEGAHADAAELLRDALDVSGDLVSPHDRLRLQILLGDAQRLAGDPAHLDLLLGTVEEADAMGDAALLGEAAFALLQLGALTGSIDLVPRIAELLTRALRRLQDGEQRALVCAAASLAFSMTGNSAECRRLFIEGEQCAHTPETRRQVLPFAYLALGHPDDHPRRLEFGRELVSLAAKSHDGVTEFEGHHLLGSALVVAGDGTGLRRSLRRMELLVDRVGDVGRRWSLLYTQASLAQLEDRLDDSDRLSEAAYGLMLPVSEARAAAALYGQLFGNAILRRQVADLAPVVEGLVKDQPGVPAWNAALALCLVESDPERTLHLLDALDSTLEPDFTWLAAHLVGGRAAALAVDAGAADPGGLVASYTERLQPYSGCFSWQGTCSYGPVDTTLALLARAGGDGAAAERLAGAARAQSEGLKAPAFVRDLEALGFSAP